MKSFHNQTFDEIEPGASASKTRTLTELDIEALALGSGDLDSFDPDTDAARPAVRKTVPTESAGLVALVSTMLNRHLPGPGTRIKNHALQFSGNVSVGDRITVTVVAREKRPANHSIVFDCHCTNQDGAELVSGTAIVAAPSNRLDYNDVADPELILRRGGGFAALMDRCKASSPVRCAVVHPCDGPSLLGALAAADRGLIVPILVGPEHRIRDTAQSEGIDLAPYQIIPVEHSHAAAEKAVAMARNGEVDALMKGSLHTDELMATVTSSGIGLRTGRRISHVFMMDVPAYPRPLLITDAAINIGPTLADKADIVRNAIDLAHALGIVQPAVAILSAVETVTPRIPSTIDAAALCKMADRGQITGGILDGPLAFDNAISADAARRKQIVSVVAGHADILVVPDLEAGNILAKQLQYLAGAESAGVVLGARVPIALTSRADTIRSRIASAALMVLLAQYRSSAMDDGKIGRPVLLIPPERKVPEEIEK